MPTSRSFSIALLVLYSIGRVSTLKCYYCESYSSGTCWKDSTSGFTQTCGVGYSQKLDSLLAFNETVQTVIATESSDDISPRALDIMDCAKFVGSLNGQQYIAKMCTLKTISCAEYGSILEKKIGYKLNSCDRCNYDFCNASNNLQAGVISVVAFIILLLLSKM